MQDSLVGSGTPFDRHSSPSPLKHIIVLVRHDEQAGASRISWYAETCLTNTVCTAPKPIQGFKGF
jgi:hypothetical protein